MSEKKARVVIEPIENGPGFSVKLIAKNGRTLSDDQHESVRNCITNIKAQMNAFDDDSMPITIKSDDGGIFQGTVTSEGKLLNSDGEEVTTSF